MGLTQDELQVLREEMQSQISTARAEDTETIQALRTQIEQLESTHSARERRAAIYGNEIPNGEMSATERKRFITDTIGNQARAMAASRGDRARAADIIEKVYGDERTAERLRSMTTLVPSDGGSLVETDYAAEVIELLYSRSVVRESGATVMPMPNGQLTLHKVSAGVTGTYTGESERITAQQPSTGQVTMTAKGLKVIVPISSELLNDTAGRANRIVVRDIIRGLSLRADLAGLRGDGTSNTPKGILSLIPAGQIIAAADSTTLAALLENLLEHVNSADLDEESMGWVLNGRLYTRFYNKQNANGVYVYRDEMNLGKLMGYPVRKTNQIPSNLGTGAAETQVYLGDWSEFIWGETDSLGIDYSTEGSYWDGTAWVNAFGTDQTLVRARGRHDFELRHTQGFVVGNADLATIS